jgi:hypothetical protein
MPLLPPPGDVVVVYRATNDFAAIAVRDALAAQGVPAMVRSRRVPGYDVPTLTADQAGIVAEILVSPDRAADARIIVDDYLAGLREAPAEEDQ